ncbi:hypothetical protein FOCG_12394 [Fusarium oxysporum f. sp. radicis-lycopersici 26381]|nr:hypothetical protein FOCG_12394 [Fusarium oxysporum f. sp. radicis-lycopersici 26381]
MSGFNEEYSLTLEFTIQSSKRLTLLVFAPHFGGNENQEIDYVNSFMPRGLSRLRSNFSPEEPDPGGACGQEVHPAPSIPPSISPLDTEGIAGEASST